MMLRQTTATTRTARPLEVDVTRFSKESVRILRCAPGALGEGSENAHGLVAETGDVDLDGNDQDGETARGRRHPFQQGVRAHSPIPPVGPKGRLVTQLS